MMHLTIQQEMKYSRQNVEMINLDKALRRADDKTLSVYSVVIKEEKFNEQLKMNYSGIVIEFDWFNFYLSHENIC